MKRGAVLLSIVVALVVIGSAGYLGTRSVQPSAAPGTPAPSTAEVTRGEVQQTVTAPGQLVATRQVTLAASVGGEVLELSVRPGEQVRAGDVVARIDPAPLEDKVAAAQGTLEVARADLAQLQAGPTPAELAAAELALAQAEAELAHLQAGPAAADLAAARADVAAAQKDLAAVESLPDAAAVALAQAELARARVAVAQAQAAYDVVRDRPDVGMLPQARALQEATISLEAAQAAFQNANRPAMPAEIQAAQARLAAAQATLAGLEQGPGEDELRLAERKKEAAALALSQLRAGPGDAEQKQAQAAVQAAEAALKLAQVELAASTLSAPFEGVVVAVHAQAGETVAAGTSLVVLADPDAVEVEASVVEEDLPLVQAGQAAMLYLDARPEAEVQGHVARTVPQRLPGDRPLYPVYITVDDLPDGLLAGMTVDASIVVAARSDVLRLPRTLVRARSDGTAVVQVWTGSGIEERLVHTGLRGDVHVEILDGLGEGDQVVAE